MGIRQKSLELCRNQSSELLRVDFEYYLKKITHTIKAFLQTTPYSQDKVFMHNLYVSCMMTLLNQITLNNYNKKRYKNRLRRGYNIDDFLNKVYISEFVDSVVLFHLPDNLENYVSTLVNMIKKLLVKDMHDLIGSFEPSDAVIQSIIASSMGDTNNNDSQ